MDHQLDPEMPQPSPNPETAQPSANPETSAPVAGTGFVDVMDHQVDPEIPQPSPNPELPQPSPNPETTQPSANPETSAPVIAELDEIRVEDKNVDDKKESDPAAEKEIVLEQTLESFLKEYYPWLIAGGLGFLLLIIAVVLLATARSAPYGFPFKPQYFNVPHFQGSMRVYSVDGQKLKYINDLRNIGSEVSRKLRYKVEPKLKYIYSNASLAVDSVVVVSFKYGGAGGESLSQAGKSILGRSSDSEEEKDAITIRHWVYLTGNFTDSLEEVKERILSGMDKVGGIKIDETSIQLESLENMTREGAINALTQAGFFKRGLAGLDLGLLDTFGISPLIGLQSEDEGLCLSLRKPEHGSISPSICTASINTYVQMACKFTCDVGFELVGSPKRVCLSSGLWSGEPVRCQKTCSHLSMTSTGSLQPMKCGSQNISAGQMCFLECPSTLQRMIFPPDLSSLRHQPQFSKWHSEDVLPMVDEFLDDARGYFRECQGDGEWMGSGASCKALCPKIIPPPNGAVTPSHCQISPVEGDRCLVSCDSNFGMVGGGNIQSLTCDVGGKWTDELASCIRLCSPINESTHMTVSPKPCSSYPYEGIKCEHECKDGYVLSGDKTRTCLNGHWDNPPAECARSCEHLDDPENGMMMSDVGACSRRIAIAGTVCTLNCDPGYVPSIVSTTCQSDGTWTDAPSALFCHKACSPIDMDASGNWDPVSCYANHYSLLGSCDLTCMVGTVHGSSSVTCSNDGVWSSSPGKCLVYCLGLSSPSNGMMDGGTHCGNGTAMMNDTCEFSCNAGYKLDGTRMLTCTDDGSWSDSIPTCEAEQQYIITQSLGDHGICLVADVHGKVKKEVKTSELCDSEGGRWIIDGSLLKNVLTRTCLTVNESSYFLYIEGCDSGNGNQMFESGFGLTLKLVGEEKYITSQFRTAEYPQITSLVASCFNKPCASDENSLWMFVDASTGPSGTTGVSLFSLSNANQCKPLMLSNSVTISPATCASEAQNPATDCSLSCSDGQLSNLTQDTATCSNGFWNVDPDIYCIPALQLQCDPFSLVLEWNIIVEPSACETEKSNPGESCSISCSNATTQYLDGSSTVTCLESGRWSPQGPHVCKQRCNGLLPLPDNSYLISDNALQCSGKPDLPSPGSSCSVSCINNYELIGQSMLTCMDNGMWSSSLPQCDAICPDIQDISHGYLGNCSTVKLPGGYLAGTSCDILCESGYFPGLSIPTISCDSSGSWVIHVLGEMDCLSSCPTFESVPPPLQVTPDCTFGTVTSGHECDFYCEDGYGLEYSNMEDDTGSDTYKRTCMSDGKWSGSPVICSKRCPPLPILGKMDTGYYNPSKCEMEYMKFGTVCSLLCPGSESVHGGPDVLTCGEDGQWKPQMSFGKCSQACHALPRSPFLNIMPQTCGEGFVGKGMECILTCPDHMERIGPGYRKCLGFVNPNTGSPWSGGIDPTRCMARCPPLVPSPGSYIFPKDCLYRSKLEGDVCSFECSPEFSLIGSADLQCTPTSIWSDAVPSCFKPCSQIIISNGELSCNEAHGYLSEGLGYVYGPGTKCYYSCHSGFTASNWNEVSCDKNGLWNPVPYCSPISNAFPIIQKIGEDSVCLQASQSGNDGSVQGSEWHVTTTQNSTQGCEAAGNNAMWIWFDSFNIKHAETGLCLSAESALSDSSILLQRCDVTNNLQHWTCDAHHPYRFVLKNTDLSIDTVYEELGPVLQSWTHAGTYWITFNPVLETAGTVCSNKLVGTCPRINKAFMKVKPEVCDSDEISIWQKCAVGCKEGSMFDGTTEIVECLPTGEWKNLDGIFCRRDCPPLPQIQNGYYNSIDCSNKSNIHQTICNLSCNDGYVLSHNEPFAPYACDDGKWFGTFGLSCQNRCKDLPTPPQNGRIDCIMKTCRVVCNMGYRIQGNSSMFNCTVAPNYLELNNVTCVEEFQFRLQLFSTYPTICMSTIIVRGQPVLAKAPCEVRNSFQYWRWDDSINEMDRDFSMLRSIATGLCLSATADEDWSILIVKPCNESDSLQQWSCKDHLNPGRFGLKASAMSYVDAGSIIPFAPPVLRTMSTSSGSSDWIAKDVSENFGYPCASRAIGSCPKLNVGPHTTVIPQGCKDWDGLQVGDECRTSCMDNFTTSNTKAGVVTKCLSSGAWSETLNLCIAKSSALGTCSYLSLSRGLIVTPEKCASYSGMDILVGETCTFACEAGLHLEGSERILCNGGDKWTSQVPKCVGYCPSLPVHQGVTVDDAKCWGSTVSTGKVCNSTCADGFVHVMDSSPFVLSECLKDGTWSNPPIFCEATCQSLSEPPFNGTSNEDDFNDAKLFRRFLTSSSCAAMRSRATTTCAISCGSGNITVGGSDEIVCQPDGRWSGQPAMCVDGYYCPAVMATNLEVSYEPLYEDVAVVPNTLAMIKCNEGYMLDGDNVRICQADGTWGGDGPVIPTCSKKCPPLVAPFASEITPRKCIEGHVSDGEQCSVTCRSGTKVEGMEELSCNNGEWSNSIPKCLLVDSKNADELKADDFRSQFLIITREPASGCLYADDSKTVSWRAAQDCDPKQLVNQWKWHDNERLMSVHEGLCMQPSNPSMPNSTLILGSCNTTLTFVCGNPRSVYQKYSVFASYPRWRLGFTTDSTTGMPKSIFMVKPSSPYYLQPKDILEGIEVYGNSDVMNPPETDNTLCSYVCSGSVTFRNDYNARYITSPRFIHNQDYPANSYCKWDFYGHGKIMTLELQELDLEQSVDVSCTTDCLKIHSNDREGSTFSELLSTYSGSNIFEQRNRIIKSVSSSLHLSFISNGVNQGRGFAMKYKFEDLPQALTSCGIRKRYDQVVSGAVDGADWQGAFTNITKWPWLVSIREKFAGSSKAYHRCTGVLISDSIVATAAHCARFTLSSTSSVDIGIGLTLQNDMDERMRKLQNQIGIFQIYHGYDYVTRNGDLALWRLSQPVVESSGVFPICLPSNGYYVHQPRQYCVSAGWNSLTQGITLNQIIEYKVEMKSSSWCKSVLGLNRKATFVCAENINFDMSGANERTESEPLMCKFNGNWYLTGLRSYTHIGTRGTYRLYTDVFRLIDWINKNTKTTSLYIKSKGTHLLAQNSFFL